jgi:hypothetical protein
LQVVSTLESKDKRQPSARLQEKIRNCVSVFRSLNETVNEVIEIGKSEGFTPKEIGQFIRQEMIKSGLSSRTVTRYLPAELKAKPRGFQVSNTNRDKMSLNHSQNQRQPTHSLSQKSPSPQSQEQQLTTDIEQFSMADRDLYRPEFLGKVIDHLSKIYNEKTGQKIIVIFRKMIDDGTSKERKISADSGRGKVEKKVLSLVKKGVIKIS